MKRQSAAPAERRCREKIRALGLSGVLERGDGGEHCLIDVVAILAIIRRDGQGQSFGGGVVFDALGERGTRTAQLLLDEPLRAVVDLAVIGIYAENGDEVQFECP